MSTKLGGFDEGYVLTRFACPDPDNALDWTTIKKWYVNTYLYAIEHPRRTFRY